MTDAVELEYEDVMNDESGSSLDTRAEQEQTKAELARKENVDVSRWRYAVAIMLTVTSGIVLAFTYNFMSRAEEDEFRSSFHQSTSTVIAASRFYAFNVINTFEGMTDTITARSLRKGDKWPFVVVEDFELAGAHARVTSFTEAVYFAPLVFGPFRDEWEGWASNNLDWIEESRSYADLTRSWLAEEEFYSGEGIGSNPGPCPSCSASSTIDEDFIRDSTLSPERGSGEIFAVAEDQADTCLKEPPCQLTRDGNRAIYAPVWQMSPPPADPVTIGFNLFSNSMMARIVSVLINSEVRSIITGLIDIQLLHAGIWSDEDHANFHASDSSEDGHAVDPMELPHSVVVTSIYSKLVGSANNRIVGFIAAVIPWDVYFSRLLPDGVDGVYAVLESTCSSVSTYLINGPTAIFIGNDDLHERDFDYTREIFDFNIFVSSSEDEVFTGDEKTRPCEYTLSLYASDAYRKRFRSSQTPIFLLVLGSVFIVTGAVFIMFLRYVGRRQAVVVETAMRTNAIVASLFPSNVRDRVIESNENAMQNQNVPIGAKQRLKNFLNGDAEYDGDDAEGHLKSKPIADLFPEATIMFCDMVGFTAWSSTRAPTDVFGLLEKVYGAFDERAKKRKVFKVETVGDQYVAVTGLPQPMKDHAVVCCRFASECSVILDALVKELEVEFGPDTADLNMRFGLHSGPVTAGVLRGERSRFQLFGDTVNTASRLESTGIAGKIQVSEETAELLIAAGKGRWLRPREEKVTAKGKGELSTYWLEKHEDSISSTKSMKMGSIDLAPSQAHDMVPPGSLTDRSARLVDYNVDVLLRLLRNVASRRKALRIEQAEVKVNFERLDGSTVLDEVQETIALPAFNAQASRREVDPSQIDLGVDVEYELRHYVSTIASLYNDNPFHNFEHVSHVAMSVAKLMSRIVAPEMEGNERSRSNALKLHDYTYGITSDPLTQFACVYSALIHDVDHLGVPNTQLALEHPDLAKMYKNKSVAEQHSVDLSWKLLMQPFYQNLQKAIFSTPEEYQRFRQLVVNSVMATDIMDPDLKKLRNKRWEKAFATQQENSTKQEDINRKATIVIEHLIQASDVSHTMQHWHIYRKWNERLFEEMYKAHLLYRSTTNPADNWAASEIGFFDFYIIPLAKKLKDCGVFGVSSFEYLDYAQRNRDEWKLKGEQIVAEMVQAVNDKLFQRQEI